MKKQKKPAVDAEMDARAEITRLREVVKSHQASVTVAKQQLAKLYEDHPVDHIMKLHVSLRCDPECRGWIVNAETCLPEICDACKASYLEVGLAEPDDFTDDDAMTAWREEVRDLLQDLITTPEQKEIVQKLFPRLLD